MQERVSTLEVRARLGDLLNRVDLRHDEFIIERKGRPLAALVPVQKLDRMKTLARRYGLEFLESQRAGGLAQAEADELAVDAVRWARRRGRKSPARRK